MAKGAIYTIGYAKLTPRRLREVMDLLHVGELMDCRSSPRTRVAGFGNRQLAAFFGEHRYSWKGETLGGRMTIASQTLTNIAALGKVERIMLMCMEEAPGECHRHYDLGMPLEAMGARVFHVFRDQVVPPLSLQKAIDTQRSMARAEYDCEDLFEHAAREIETARAAQEGK